MTNGLGGYASGTIAGVTTRRYHGQLVAALSPPTGRTVLVGDAMEWATYAGVRYPLSTHAFQDGTVYPRGYRHIQEFRLEGTIPVWVFALGDALLERRIWMRHEANTTFMQYTVIRANDAIDLEIIPLVTYRDFHSLSSGAGWSPGTVPRTNGVTVHAFDGATPFHLDALDGTFASEPQWYWGFHHQEETARGLDDRSDLFAPGSFHTRLEPGTGWRLAMSAEGPSVTADATALAHEQTRQSELLRSAQVQEKPGAIQQLVLAADQFIVQRQRSNTDGGSRGVIAGYHWFSDWGRDTMISLPGLTLATGRPTDTAAILHEFAHYVADGLLPNNFPDRPGVDPGYNTADAALWYIWAVQQYLTATGDRFLVQDLLPTLRSIVEHYTAGTRYGIGVDPADGLLRAGEPGVQLTWMDAKVGDWVVTPRIGKPIELNALWHNALQVLADMCFPIDRALSEQYRAQAKHVVNNACSRFWDQQRGIVADVLDGPDGDDWSQRPNQILAVSLPYPMFESTQAETIVRTVGRSLLTSYGLRSLAPSEPGYQPTYSGNQHQRDGAYHQGTVWAWLIGPYAEAHFRVHDDRAAALALLQPLTHHLTDAGLGSVSEIFEGEAPHIPRGCIAQAWSVAELLRVYTMLTSSGLS